MTRKFTALAFLFAILVALPAQAQWQLGAFGGIASGRMYEENPAGNNTTDDDKALMSVVLGLSAQRPLGSTLLFAPEAMYVTKGYRDDDSDGKITMSYIEIPLLLRYPFETTGMIKPYVFAGPEVALQLACNYFDADGDKQSCDDQFGSDESYKSIDAGLVIGAGVTREKFSLSVRYDVGMLNTSVNSDWTSKHRAIMVLFGCTFR